MINACCLELLTSSGLDIPRCPRHRGPRTPWQFAYLLRKNGYAALSSPTGIKQTVMGLRTLNPWEPTAAPARTVEPASYAVFCSYGLLLRWIVVNLIKFATMRTMDRRFQTRSLAMYARDETALVGEDSKTAQNFHFTESCSNAYKDSCKAYVKWLILMTTKISQKHLYGYSSYDFKLFFAKHPRTSIRCCGDRMNK
jgi:hypothetical protein